MEGTGERKPEDIPDQQKITEPGQLANWRIDAASEDRSPPKPTAVTPSFTTSLQTGLHKKLER